MPVYSLTSHAPITEDIKQKLVNIFTDAHCSIMVAPEQFVHILFFEGYPILDNKRLYVHANVRAGRNEDTISKLRTVLSTQCAEALQVEESDIHINLLEIQAKWIMEGGHIMPDPGEEDAWMEKVTQALAEREASLTK